MALPNIVTNRALGADGGVPASERLTLGFIGMGRQMGGHVGTFLGREQCQVLAVCDVESRRLEKFKTRVDEHYAQKSGQGAYAGCAAYRDYRDLLAREDI
ncbi:MAG: gfo/Idh/MocA family oxidoreductase, partial [Candidatus Hydrogenedentes bacterium]|nr:gfo/Idh/MocA family oxidoreductase [Candidatus Hydrogenedentota bacterium]